MNYYKSGSLFKIPNKFWEINFVKLQSSNNILDFNIGLTTNCDHSGLLISFTLFNYYAHFQIYDNRHWNSEQNCYE